MKKSIKSIIFSLLLIGLLVVGVICTRAYTLSANAGIDGGWGDSAGGRPGYTTREIEDGALGDAITFNSITDGKIGDEKNFVGAIVRGSAADSWTADSITVKDGETYTIRAYVHNNSPLGEDAVAEGVTATFSLPTMADRSHNIIAYIDSTNAKPCRYWDGVSLKSAKPFYIEYVPGSASFTNGIMENVPLSDDIIHTGAALGYSSLDGRIPGCFMYDGVVTIDVTVHYAKTR